jgi:hypothetical protein
MWFSPPFRQKKNLNMGKQFLALVLHRGDSFMAAYSVSLFFSFATRHLSMFLCQLLFHIFIVIFPFCKTEEREKSKIWGWTFSLLDVSP